MIITSRRLLRVLRLLAAVALAAGTGFSLNVTYASVISLTVNTTADDSGTTGCAGVCTLRDAIQLSNAYPASTTVNITIPTSPSEAYQITNGELAAHGAALKVTGFGPSKSVLDAGGQGTILNVSPPASATITGLGFTGANSGAIVATGPLSLINDAFSSKFLSNDASVVRALYMRGGKVVASVFENNTAVARPAIEVEGPTLVLGNRIDHNSADESPALTTCYQPLTVIKPGGGNLIYANEPSNGPGYC
jgi:CSLREA domain-containing protein